MYIDYTESRIHIYIYTHHAERERVLLSPGTDCSISYHTLVKPKPSGRTRSWIHHYIYVIYVYDCICIWLYMYMIVYVYDYICIWLYMYMIIYVYDCICIWLYMYMIIYGCFLSHGGTPFIIRFRLGFSMKKTIQLLGYLHLWKPPYIQMLDSPTGQIFDVFSTGIQHLMIQMRHLRSWWFMEK